MKKYIQPLLLIIAAAGFSLMLTSATVRSDVIAQSDCQVFIVPDVGTITFCRLANSDTPTPAPTIASKTTATPAPTNTATLPPTATGTAANTPTATDVPQVTETVTPLPPPTVTQAASVPPYQSAPACEHTSFDVFHTLWDDAGCHYTHEHGTNPFTPQVANAFPGFDLFALLGDVQIGHTNPSSPMENTHKHGGFKWDVNTAAPNGCAVGFESGTVAVDAYAIQYHSFGRQDVEFEANKHSATALLRQCKAGNPRDKGYVFVTTLQHYGERCTPYQGITLQYPDDFLPRWNCAFGPYFTTDNTTNRVLENMNEANNSKWTSKITGSGARPPHSKLFRLLFDIRDNYQLLDMSDLVHPFTWLWKCGRDVYNPVGCEYNNSTGRIHEIMGDIPAAWDNVAGLDSDPRVGRITGEFFVDFTGTLKADCTTAGGACYPVKLVSAFVGRYSSNLCAGKCSVNTPDNTPERDLYWCNGVLCSETSPGAIPSGWIGSEN